MAALHGPFYILGQFDGAYRRPIYLYKCNQKSASKLQEYKIQMTNNTGPNFVKLDLSG